MLSTEEQTSNSDAGLFPASPLDETIPSTTEASTKESDNYDRFDEEGWFLENLGADVEFERVFHCNNVSGLYCNSAHVKIAL
jgi:hypothetical protein